MSSWIRSIGFPPPPLQSRRTLTWGNRSPEPQVSTQTALLPEKGKLLKPVFTSPPPCVDPFPPPPSPPRDSVLRCYLHISCQQVKLWVNEFSSFIYYLYLFNSSSIFCCKSLFSFWIIPVSIISAIIFDFSPPFSVLEYQIFPVF